MRNKLKLIVLFRARLSTMVTNLIEPSWKDIEYFDDAWEKRISLLLSMMKIQSRMVVCDLGCGMQILRRKLPEDVIYVPIDYKSRSNDTLVCDFNNKEFPELRFDVGFVSGCLEYVEDVEWFVKSLASSCDFVLISYCVIDNFQNIINRKKLSWVNHLSRSDILRLFSMYNFTCIAERVGETTPAYLAFCFKHNKSHQDICT